jgi:hypothetical protein
MIARTFATSAVFVVRPRAYFEVLFFRVIVAEQKISDVLAFMRSYAVRGVTN